MPWHHLLCLCVLLIITTTINAIPKAIDVIQSAGHLEEHNTNFCNRTDLAFEGGLQKTALGQFLGYPCSADFYHCRWQSDGYRTYKKSCRVGLVFDTAGTQNCNYDYNVKGCAITSNPEKCTNVTDFSCPLSEHCVSIGQRCDGVYDCVLEEDEQNCPMCKSEEFPCIISEQCIPMSGRCNGIKECKDGTDEQDCDICPADNFFCRKSQKCIPSIERCDGISQCPQGEDEQLCKKGSNQPYMCENRQNQVAKELVCDGKPDCPDESDELYCLQPPSRQPLNGAKSIEENLISENLDPSLPQIQSVPGQEVPSPISSDKTPPGTGKLAIASFPRIRFNGHSEEGSLNGGNLGNGEDSALTEDTSPATVVVSDGSEAINTGRLISTEFTSEPTDITTIEPYLATIPDNSNDQKQPVMHMMKKYRPPAEKYMSSDGSVGCDQTEPIEQVEQVTVDQPIDQPIEQVKAPIMKPDCGSTDCIRNDQSYPQPSKNTQTYPQPSINFQQQRLQHPIPAYQQVPPIYPPITPSKENLVHVVVPECGQTVPDCVQHTVVCNPCPQSRPEVPEYVGQQGRKQFTQPTTVNLFHAETPSPIQSPQTIETTQPIHSIEEKPKIQVKLDPLHELSKKYGTSKTELLKKIEQILRNETTTVQSQEPIPKFAGSMFAPPGQQSTETQPFHRMSKTIHVTGKPHKWQPSLSTNQRLQTTTQPSNSFRSRPKARRPTKFH